MTTGDIGERGGGLQPAGWYPDAANPARERLWTGERWIEWIRPVKAGRVEDDPAGWRPDPRQPRMERLWSGEMWTEETRLIGGGGSATAPSSRLPAPVAGAPMPMPRQGAVVLHHDDRPPEALRTLGILTQIGLVAVILAALVELVANGFYIGVLGDFLAHRPPSVSHIESVIDAVHSTRTIVLIAEAVTALAFLCWFYRAYRNLIRTGIRDVRFGPGWAIGGWFIPFFNFVRPKQVANDIWKGSASAGTIGIARWREIALPGLINWWWGVWIFGGVMVSLGSHALTRAQVDRFYTADTLRHERAGVWFAQIGLAALIVAAVLAILLIRQISRMQDEHFKAVPAWNPDAPSPGYPWAATPAAAAVATTSGAAATTPSPAGTKTCPDCAEDVKAAARVCRYCGYRFEPPD